MITPLIAVVASLCLAVNGRALTPRSAYVEHERRSLETNTRKWNKGQPAKKDLLVHARVALIPTNMERGHDLLMEVSDPTSEKYGKHYTPEEINDLFSPSDVTIKSVKSWLEEQFANVTIPRNRQYLRFDAKLADLENFLGTEYNEYLHQETGKMSLGCEHYSVPAYLREHIDFITPGLTMAETLEPEAYRAGLMRRHLPKGRHSEVSRPFARPLPFPVNETWIDDDQKIKKGCSEAVTPRCIRELYNIHDEIEHTPGDGNSIGAYENLLDFLSEPDLNKFLGRFIPTIGHKYPTENLIDGAPSPKINGKKSPGGESILDFTAIYPLVNPIPIHVYQTDDDFWEESGPNGLFNTMLDYFDGSYCTKKAFGLKGDTPGFDAIYPDKHKNSKNPFNHPHECGIAKPPLSLSISYSAQESDLSTAYLRRQCQEFMKLGMQGVSIFGASGDDGVAGNGVCDGAGGDIFVLDALTDCPYVTAVGGTILPKGGKAGITREIAVKSFGSGGGFSPVFTTPSYQKEAVTNYLTKHKPPYKSFSTKNNPHSQNVTGRFNRNGRGVPDVSIIGDKFVDVFKGKFELNGGTSVSAPLWAGIIARINGARIAAGKSSVGFINPALYANPGIFNDVVKGNNRGCHTKGFEAAKGWDPVTGLGTPNYKKLKKMFMAMP